MGHLFVNFKGFFGVLTRSMKTEPTTVFYVPLYYVEEEWRLGKLPDPPKKKKESSTTFQHLTKNLVAGSDWSVG